MSDIVNPKNGGLVVPQAESIDATVAGNSADIFLYLRILWKRRWAVVAGVIVVLVATAARIYLSTPLYRATARIQIEPEAKILPYQDNSAVVNADYIATQCEILRSDSLARRVAQKMGPTSMPEGSEVKPNWIRRNVSVLPMPGTMVVKLSFDAADPEVAAQVVNALTAEYVDHHFESKYESSVAARDVLRGELEDLKTKVEESERSLVDYALQNNQALLSDPGDNVIQKRLSDLNSQLRQVESDLLANKYQDIRRAPDEPLPETLKSTAMKELERRQAELADRLSALSEQFGPKWPEVRSVQREIALVNKRMEAEKGNIVEQAKVQYDLLKAHRERLLRAVGGQNSLVQQLNRDSIFFSILKREAETNQQLYDALLQSYKEATISAGLRTVNIRVIDRASVPGVPYSPNIPLNVALGCGLGLISGVTLAFSLESLDKTVTTPRQVYQDIGLATLGVIPQTTELLSSGPDRTGRKLVRSQTNGGSWGQGRHPLGLIEPAVEDNTKQLLRTLPADCAESYRNLRTRLILAPELRRVKTILVTSALPGEGKSTTCANLAASLAGLRARTLILELDLRNPRLHHQMNVSPHRDHKLADYLSGRCSIHETLNPTPNPNLFVAFAGSSQDDPAEMISSERLDQALRRLSEDFTYVVIDAPPILPVSDTMVLACKADGVVLVIRAGKTSREAVQEAQQRVIHVGGRFLGAVINGADTHSVTYTYGRAYGAGGAGSDTPVNDVFRGGDA